MKKYLLPLLNISFILSISFLVISCVGTDTDSDDYCTECEGDHSTWEPISKPISFDKKKRSYRGTLVVGRDFENRPAMKTFQVDGSEKTFWVDTDSSKEVANYIERIIHNDLISGVPYKPRRITLNGYFQPAPETGILSKLDGIFVAKGMY